MRPQSLRARAHDPRWEARRVTIADFWALILMLAGGLMVWSLAGRMAEGPDRAFLQRVVAATFGLRAAFSVFLHVLYPRAWSTFAADAIARYSWGRRDAELWHLGLWQPRLPQTLSEAHSTVVQLKTTALIYLFGPSPMLPEAFVITLNVTVCVAVYLLCRQIGATRRATSAAVLFSAFMPTLVFWSTQDLKDPVCATCVAWAMLGMLKVGERAHGGWLLVMIGADLFALIYRPYVGILLMVGQGLAWVYSLRLPQTALGHVSRAALFAMIAPVAMYVGVQEMKSTYGEDIGLEWAVESYAVFRQSGIDAGSIHGSEYEIPLTASTPTQAIIQLPIRVLLLLLTPIPLFPGTFRKLLTYPEMWFIYLYVIPRFGLGIREAWRKNRGALLTILLALTPIIVSYSLKTAVSGEAIRMRSQFMPLLLIFAGVGHAIKERRKAAMAERAARPDTAVTYVRQRREEAGS